MKTKKIYSFLVLFISIVIVLCGCHQKADYYTRGIGVYPGKPAEDFSPNLVPDKGQYRNIAKLRPSYNSSSYDYNLTAQLITDGIIINTNPEYIAVSTSNGIVPRNEREWLLDHNRVTTYGIEGSEIWLQLDLSSSTNTPEITSIKLNGNVTYDENKPKGWKLVCSGSDDGIKLD